MDMKLKKRLFTGMLEIILMGSSFAIIKYTNNSDVAQAAYVTPYIYRGTWIGKISSGGYTKLRINANSVSMYFKDKGSNYYYSGTGYYKGKTHYNKGISEHGIFPKSKGEGETISFHNGKVTLLIAGTQSVCHKVK